MCCKSGKHYPGWKIESTKPLISCRGDRSESGALFFVVVAVTGMRGGGVGGGVGASPVAVLFVHVHFVLGAEELAAEAGERVAALGVHDGRVRAQRGRVAVHASADRARPRLVERQLARLLPACRVSTKKNEEESVHRLVSFSFYCCVSLLARH